MTRRGDGVGCSVAALEPACVRPGAHRRVSETPPLWASTVSMGRVSHVSHSDGAGVDRTSVPRPPPSESVWLGDRLVDNNWVEGAGRGQCPRTRPAFTMPTCASCYGRACTTHADCRRQHAAARPDPRAPRESRAERGPAERESIVSGRCGRASCFAHHSCCLAH